MKKTLVLLTLLSAALHAQVPIKGTTVDATQGYTVNGAAPNNQPLCGNGTLFVPAANCGTVVAPFYQTIQGNGSALPQRFILNFDSNFTVNDSSPSTTVHLTPIAQTSVTTTFGTVRQNTTGRPLFVTGFGTISGGSGDSRITCSDGLTSGLGITLWSNTTTATNAGSPVAFTCGNPIPAGYFYSVTVTNIISGTPGSWVETN